jgi:hypothetical protein
VVIGRYNQIEFFTTTPAFPDATEGRGTLDVVESRLHPFDVCPHDGGLASGIGDGPDDARTFWQRESQVPGTLPSFLACILDQLLPGRSVAAKQVYEIGVLDLAPESEPSSSSP